MEIEAGHLVARLPDIPLLADDSQSQATIDRIVGNAARLALLAVADAIAVVAPRDTGDLVNSFRADPATTVGGLEVTGHTFAEDAVVGRLFSTLPQAVVMDTGRDPGFGVNAAGIEALAGWASRHWGVEGKAALRAAFALATVIRQRGLPSKDYVAAALPLAQATIDQIFANAGEAIASALSGAGA